RSPTPPSLTFFPYTTLFRSPLVRRSAGVRGQRVESVQSGERHLVSGGKDRAGRRSGLPAVAGHRQRGTKRSPGGETHRLENRHQVGKPGGRIGSGRERATRGRVAAASDGGRVGKCG